MDYKKLAIRLKCPKVRECPIEGEIPSCQKCQYRISEKAALAITDLLARAEAAEAQLEAVRRILSDPLIVCGENNTLRPVKRTSKQDVYTTVLKAQKAAGVMERWFPKEWEEEK